MNGWAPFSVGRAYEAARGALLGTFVGDALGMPWEGMPPDAIPDQPEMVDARLGLGTYTDDTEMMIGLAESLVAHGELIEGDIAHRFLEGCDLRRGYGSGTREVFDLWRCGYSVEEAADKIFEGSGSHGNGAAMRIAPVGVRFANSDDLADHAVRSARVTHTHPLGVDAAVAQAAAVAAAVRGDDPLAAARAAAETSTLQTRLSDVASALDTRPTPADAAVLLGNTSAAHESVPLAIYCVCSSEDFEAAVVAAVRSGGDTDTIAAMAGAVAGARFGGTAIPSRWLAALEDGPRGRTHVERLAERLAVATTAAARV
jgi:poly(ADP-ribose) glycohydrolase ARH3